MHIHLSFLFVKRTFSIIRYTEFENLADCVSPLHARNSHPEVFYKEDVLKNFGNFTGKHLCQSARVPGVSLKFYYKRDSGTSVFL